MKPAWLLVSLCAFAQPVHAADDIWITFGGVSHHADREASDNERNFGLGIQVGLTPTVRAIAQGFRNTHRVDSTLIGVAWSPWDLYASDALRIRPTLVVGSLTGYDLDAMPVAFPALAFEGKRFGVDYALFKERGDGGLVHALGFKVKW